MCFTTRSEQAEKYFDASYERSGDSIEKIDVRGKRANEWYEVLKNYE